MTDNTSFQKKRHRRKGKEEIPKEDWKDPEVWFSICVSWNKDPYDIVTMTRHGLYKSGGRRLQVRELQRASLEDAIVKYHMYNQVQ